MRVLLYKDAGAIEALWENGVLNLVGQLEKPTARYVDVVMRPVSMVIVAATHVFGTCRFTLNNRKCKYTIVGNCL